MLLWQQLVLLAICPRAMVSKRPCALSVRFLTAISRQVRSNGPALKVPRASLHNELTSASSQSGLRHSSVMNSSEDEAYFGRYMDVVAATGAL